VFPILGDEKMGRLAGRGDAVLRTVLCAAFWMAPVTQAASRTLAPVTGVWAKAGRDRATTDADFAACKKDASVAPVHVEFIAGGALGYLATFELQREKLNREAPEFERHCMGHRGYVWLAFTGDEQAKLDSRATPADRSAWIGAFYAGDLATRIDKVRGPSVAPLPEARSEPNVFEGVRFDPATLSVPQQTVAEGHAALVGSVSHRRTARLKNALDMPLASNLHADAGTIVHEVVYPSEYEPQQTFWCGPMRAPGGGLLRGGGLRMASFCLSNGEWGYDVTQVEGPTWLNRGPEDGRVDSVGTWARDISLDESDVDLLGPMQFTLLVKQVDPDSVSLEARANRGNQTVWFWRGLLAFDRDGKATLPFWGYRLVLTHDLMSVRAAFTPDGDGSGWEAAKLAHGAPAS
jgi:hypothetical protein